jgi:hypothetical protein
MGKCQLRPRSGAFRGLPRRGGDQAAGFGFCRIPLPNKPKASLERVIFQPVCVPHPWIDTLDRVTLCRGAFEKETLGMAVAVIIRYPNLSPTIYDDAIASLDLDANPPAGAVLHVAAEAEGGLVVTEIWRTEQTFQAFYDYRLVPALRTHGMATQPQVEVAPLHNLFAVEMDTVERMGAVSLPATYAGAAL